MPARTTAVRPSLVRIVGALFALSLLAGCGETAPEAEETTSAPAASDAGGTAAGEDASDAGGASDGGGRTAAAVPQEPYTVTPAPDGFTPPSPCSGEGAYFAKVGESVTPDLPERAGETLTITLSEIEGEDAHLTATLGDGTERPIEGMTLGESATVDLWTISVTSVCEDTQQVEFDLID